MQWLGTGPAGVMLVDLQAPGHEQGKFDLFSAYDERDAGQPPRDRAPLVGAMDEPNRRFGRGLVAIACMRQERHGGAPRQERRSPRYPTRVGEIVTVRASRGLRRLIKHKHAPADDALIAAVASR